MLTKAIRIKPATLSLLTLLSLMPEAFGQAKKPLFNDAQLQITNYVQEGLRLNELGSLMGDKVGRAVVFGIPLQQKWDYSLSGERAPTYYLDTDASLYFYSFTDAVIGEQYLNLSEQEQSRLVPLINGFNPTDMYAVDHIKRVLNQYPGVFYGIGEFGIHRESISPKIKGHPSSLYNDSLDEILALAGEVGLVSLIRCDIDTVFNRGDRPAHLSDIKRLFSRHRSTPIIWSHTGLGRLIKPSTDHVTFLRDLLTNPKLNHVYLDLSWSEVAKQITKDPETLKSWTHLIWQYPTRFLFGTDEMAPATQKEYLSSFHLYEPLWEGIGPTAKALVTKENFNRIFNAAKERIGLWEKKNLKKTQAQGPKTPSKYRPLFNDVHLHLTNYIQEGATAHEMLALMGDRVPRAMMAGIPLQKKWNSFMSKERAPSDYLHSDSNLYYYSFTDASTARDYKQLSLDNRKRLDPMIIGFNPTDMYASEHIKRVIKMYPGVFSGIGEFSIHKEFVSSKIAGHSASLRNEALGSILETAGEIGLIVLIHCDIDTILNNGDRPVHYDDIVRLFAAHQNTTIIWAHTGLGHFVTPSPNHIQLLEEILARSDLSHVYFDISWDEVGNYINKTNVSSKQWAKTIEKYPTRFLFGSDSVAPKKQSEYISVFSGYRKLWRKLSKESMRMVTIENYTRLFDAANKNVRKWESEHSVRIE